MSLRFFRNTCGFFRKRLRRFFGNPSRIFGNAFKNRPEHSCVFLCQTGVMPQTSRLKSATFPSPFAESTRGLTENARMFCGMQRKVFPRFPKPLPYCPGQRAKQSRTACKTVLDTMQNSPGQRARLPRKKCGISRSKVRNFRPETSEHSDGKCGTSPHAFRTARFHLAELPVPAGGKPGRDACTHAPKHQENSICSARTNRN